VAHDDDAHESMGRAERGSEPGHSTPRGDEQLNHRIHQRILHLARNDETVKPESIRRQLWAEGHKVSPEYVTDVLKKHGLL
jgi:hypothetical protein